jgi:hypothetical protein
MYVCISVCMYVIVSLERTYIRIYPLPASLFINSSLNHHYALHLPPPPPVSFSHLSLPGWSPKIWGRKKRDTYIPAETLYIRTCTPTSYLLHLPPPKDGKRGEGRPYIPYIVGPPSYRRRRIQTSSGFFFSFQYFFFSKPWWGKKNPSPKSK